MTETLKKLIKKILKYFNLSLSRIDIKKNLPVETEKKIIKFINISNQFSMTGHQRMYLLSQAVLNAKNKRLEGDFVECGIWKGGNILLYKLLNDFYDLKKTIFAYDTFDGMTTPDKNDIDFQGNLAYNEIIANKKINDKNNIHCFSSISSVQKNILKYSNLKNIKFIIGPVEKTLLSKENLPKKISILRLDTDWYASTKIELEILYPKLVNGGVLIIDDYGHWQGCRKATDEFFFNKKKWLHVVDKTCRYLIKE